MKTRLGCLIALVAASAALALAMSASAAYAAEGECSNITGSGSSLQNIAQTSVWIPGFEAQKPHEPVACEAKLKEPKVTYTATSSGKGLACWGASKGEIELKECGNEKELDAYIDTDVAPEGPATTEGKQLFDLAKAGNQNSKEPNQVTAVPVAQSAVSVIVSLPEGCQPVTQAKKARVKDNELEQAWFSGQTKLSQLKLAYVACQPIQTKEAILYARSKASGTTAGFKRFLDQVKHSDWDNQVETAAKAESTTWPSTGVQVANGTGKEEAEKVYNTPNSMGYADLSDARAVGFTQTPTQHKNGQLKYYSFIVEVQNKERQTEGPTYASPEISPEAEKQAEGSNCLKAEYENLAALKVGPDQDWSKARQVKELEGTEGGTYPICTLTFDIAWQHYGFFKETESPFYKTDLGTADTVLDYLSYIVSEKTQKEEKLDKLHYAPLPAEVAEKSRSGVIKENIGL
jgi:hypothetical protein